MPQGACARQLCPAQCSCRRPELPQVRTGSFADVMRGNSSPLALLKAFEASDYSMAAFFKKMHEARGKQQGGRPGASAAVAAAAVSSGASLTDGPLRVPSLLAVRGFLSSFSQAGSATAPRPAAA